MVQHPAFESVFAFCIVLNTLAIVADVQYRGFDVGYNIGFPGYEVPAADVWPGVKDILEVLEVIFGLLFTVEVVLKIAGLRLRFFTSSWNLVDLTIVLVWVVTEALEVDVFFNPMILRLFRLARLLRLVRLLRWVQALDHLHVLIKSIRSAFTILVWAALLIGVMISFMALIVNHFSQSALEDKSKPLEQRHEVYRLFGTFTRSCISLFEGTVGNIAPVMRKMIDNAHEVWALFFIMYKLVFGFSVISVITGVFIKETFKVAESDSDLMVIQQRRQRQAHFIKMNRLFEVGDREGKGALSYEDFKLLLGDEFVQAWLAAYELDVTDVDLIYRLLDAEDGKITAADLMKGVSRLKGHARSLDLHAMMADLNMVARRLERHSDALEQNTP